MLKGFPGLPESCFVSSQQDKKTLVRYKFKNLEDAFKVEKVVVIPPGHERALHRQPP